MLDGITASDVDGASSGCLGIGGGRCSNDSIKGFGASFGNIVRMLIEYFRG